MAPGLFNCLKANYHPPNMDTVKQVRVHLRMYPDGFTINDGPLRDPDEAQNRAFFADLMAGKTPAELLQQYPGRKINLYMERINVNSSWIKLNVGGKVFQTSKQTLQSRPGTFLAQLCAQDGQLPSAKDESGAILIDRNPDYFSVVLDYLRHGDLVFGPNCSLEGIRKEADFFNLPELVELCQIQLDEADLNRKKQALLYEKKALLCQKQLDEPASLRRKKALRLLMDKAELNDQQKLTLELAENAIELKKIQFKIRGDIDSEICSLENLTLNDDANIRANIFSGSVHYKMNVDIFKEALIHGGFKTKDFSQSSLRQLFGQWYIMEM